MTLLQRLGAAFRPAKPIARRSVDAAPYRPWTMGQGGGRLSSESLAAAGPLRIRARRAYANYPHARAAVEAWVTALVRTGARATPTHPDDDTRGLITAATDVWSESATLDGLTDWYGLQADAVRAMVIDGEALLQMIDTPLGLRLRQLPAEMLDESVDRDLPGGGFVVGGIEHDSWGRRLAYWIRRENPASPWAGYGAPERIDAADIIHLFRPRGAGQVRGISWLEPVLGKLNDVDRLSDALLKGASVAASFAGFVEQDGMPGVDETAQQPFAFSDRQEIEPGTIRVLPPGSKVNFASPQQAQQTNEFMSSELRAVAVGMGVPAHLVSGDLTGANYSSLRADLVSFRQRVAQIQYQIMAPQMLQRVHERAVTSLAMMGDLDAPDFWTNRRAWTAAEWIMPAQPWIDPKKDAEGLSALIDAGLMSRTEAVAERGWAVASLDKQIAADRAREARLGLSFGAATVARQPKEESEDD